MPEPTSSGFPDAARSELERTIEELIDRAQGVLRTQSRLRSLMRANSLIVEKLDLEEVLRRIVEAAIELVDAQYGALGVVAPEGHLERFLHVGMPDAEAVRIGHLPEGHGLLGAVIDTGENIRLAHIADDHRSAGFPAHHPEMDSFLGVPIRVGDDVFGNLYLTNRAGGAFTAEDEDLVAALAATAGVAISNARLFDETERRRQWNAALTDVTAALLSGSSDVLAVIADRAGSIVDADLVSIVVPTDDPEVLRVELARGSGATDLEGDEFGAAGSLAGRALAEGSLATTDADATRREDGRPALGPAIALPLVASGRALGALTLERAPGRQRFSPAELGMASEFAAQAGVAIELGRAREDRQRLELVGERGRIARDLHDHVIQRLFATGLGLQSLADQIPERAGDVARHVDAIDAAIADIRTAVFTLGQSAGATTRHRLLDVATESATSLGFPPRVTFSGAVDLLVTGALADDVIAVAREGLANVARHAGAANVVVELAVDDREARVTIEDDGVGIPDDLARRSGTGNLADRAALRGGTFALTRRGEGGTRLEWAGPIDRLERG